MLKAPHPTNALATNVRREHRTEPIPPKSHRLVADVDAPFEQQVFHIPKAEREPHVQHHNQPNDLG
jgi:hypothetical protein